uniref:Uncharacterized protein n=1 Tax=Rhizophora mucronata TaxID=61149 RepID=A0A2P2R2G9_RHIMU
MLGYKSKLVNYSLRGSCKAWKLQSIDIITDLWYWGMLLIH